MKTLLRATNLQKTYHNPKARTVLKGISLELQAGMSIAIMGASGEGKSTLLHILGTIDTPTSGQLEIAGEIATKKTAPLLRNRALGFVFQSFHLLDDYNALENVLMPARIAGLAIHPKSAAYARGMELLAQMGVETRAHMRTTLLSGGEKQRIALARALINDPLILLADEPTGNLDLVNSELIHSLLLNVCSEGDKGLIVVTHNRDLAGLCDRLYILRQGILEVP